MSANALLLGRRLAQPAEAETECVFAKYGRYYDLIYQDKDYAAEVDYVIATLRGLDVDIRSLLELGAGTGRHGRLFAERGFDVTGIERSYSMVAAAQRVESATTGSFTCQHGDIRTADLGRDFDAVISLFHVVSYQTTNAELADTFATASRHLRPDGVFLFDVWHGPAVLTQRPSVRVKELEDDTVKLWRLAEPELDMNAGVVAVHYSILACSKTDSRLTTFKEEHRMRYLFPSEIQFLASQTGFAVERSEEFVTRRPPSEDTWGVAYLLAQSGLMHTATPFIPVNEPLLDGNEKRYLAECIDTGWISSEGPFVERLERGMALRTGRAYGVAVCNGSAALDVAVAALGLQPGDEVILPTFTIISCAAAIVRAGCTPVVVDADPVTWNMDAEQVAAVITSRTRAIMIVHIYGLPVDMDPILALAKQHDLRVIEDAAQMHGQTYKGRPCGSFGDVSTFSFYPNKHVTTGEGGMVLTDDPQLAERCRSLRNLCFQKKRFVHDELGWNFRISNVQAAIGVAQLERLDEFVARKRRMGRRYTDLLGHASGLQLPLARTDYADNVYWVYGVVLGDDVSFDAEEAMRRLSASGVGTRPFFWPMHQQPVFGRMGLFANVRCPVAERLAARGFYLPSGLNASDEQLETAASCCAAVLEL